MFSQSLQSCEHAGGASAATELIMIFAGGASAATELVMIFAGGASAAGPAELDASCTEDTRDFFETVDK